VTTHFNSDDEDIKILAKKLLFSINEDIIYESEIVGSKSAEDNNIQIKDKI